MKRLTIFWLISVLLLSGCAQFQEAAKERVQEGKLAPSEAFTPVAGQGWQKVAVFENKDQGAETTIFNIPDQRWKIAWEINIPKREAGTFSIEIYREDGKLLDKVYAETPYGATREGRYSESTYFYEGTANFRLKVGTRNLSSWRTTVETLSAPNLSPAEVVRNFYQALNQGNISDAEKLLSPGKGFPPEMASRALLLKGKIKEVKIAGEKIGKRYGADYAEVAAEITTSLTETEKTEVSFTKLQIQGTKVFELSYPTGNDVQDYGWKIANPF